jgi:hypothetical protein
MLETVGKLYVRSKIQSLQKLRKKAIELQEKEWQHLMKSNKSADYVKQFGGAAKDYTTFAKSFPVVTYENIKPFIQRMMKGAQNVLCTAPVHYFSKSSGTTDVSKFIPVTKAAMFQGHFLASRHLLASYFERFPANRIFSGKHLVIGGSVKAIEGNAHALSGDVSALLTMQIPAWIQRLRTPDLATALLPDWEEKLVAIAQKTLHENVTGMSGVPSWSVEVLKKALEISGKKNISELWQNFELFVHGGVSFHPYRAKFEALVGKPLNYINAYNASEGFFAFSDTSNTNELLLLPAHGIFFEFRAVEQPHSIVPLEGVQKNILYELIISTNSGLWRYALGDTIEFVSLHPFRFLIKGRTKQFINVTGEELMVHNAEKAIELTCQKLTCMVREFSAAPLALSNGSFCHQWFIEFEMPPASIQSFAEELDAQLQLLNSDYKAKRSGNFVLKQLEIISVPDSFFRKWLAKKHHLGAQHKIPRLSNDRKFADEFLKDLA